MKPQSSAYINTTADIFETDFRQTQLDAIFNKANTSHGIYITSDRYVLFKGSTYNSSDTSNYTVMLPASVRFQNIDLPSSQIVFRSYSGEVTGYNAADSTLSLVNINDNATNTYSLNYYGTLTKN